ncbi:MAG: hypothetical protein M5R36_17155 [Deltaproteobacteria bacterium]|nr:hypothetical protein [Deltaproteobacteria bacterium]
MSADGSCYASLTGAGNFLIRSEYAGCADTIGFDAVERMETAEQAVCRFQVFLEDSCAGSPGENAEPSCADVLADYFQGCYGYTEREAEQEASSVCGYLSAEDRACLTACSEFADDCNEFEECLASEGCFVS